VTRWNTPAGRFAVGLPVRIAPLATFVLAASVSVFGLVGSPVKPALAKLRPLTLALMIVP
jgi:hypothetical protein